MEAILLLSVCASRELPGSEGKREGVAKPPRSFLFNQPYSNPTIKDSLGLDWKVRDIRTEGVDRLLFSYPHDNEVRRKGPHLDRATPATSLRNHFNHTHVLVHWESCLQGLETPATEPALPTRTTGGPGTAGQNNHYGLRVTVAGRFRPGPGAGSVALALITMLFRIPSRVYRRGPEQR